MWKEGKWKIDITDEFPYLKSCSFKRTYHVRMACNIGFQWWNYSFLFIWLNVFIRISEVYIFLIVYFLYYILMFLHLNNMFYHDMSYDMYTLYALYATLNFKLWNIIQIYFISKHISWVLVLFCSIFVKL